MFFLQIFTPGGDKTIRFRITDGYNDVVLCILVSGAQVSWDFFSFFTMELFYFALFTLGVMHDFF